MWEKRVSSLFELHFYPILNLSPNFLKKDNWTWYKIRIISLWSPPLAYIEMKKAFRSFL